MVNEFPLIKLTVIESVIPAPFRALSRISTESFLLFQSFRLDRNLSSNPESIRDRQAGMTRIRSGMTNRTKIQSSVSRNSFDKHS